MKRKIIIFSLFISPVFLYALENSMLNLSMPSGLETHQAQFFLDHRFLGRVLKDKPMDSFFGMANGAIVRFGFRIPVWKKLEGIASYTIYQKEYILGTGYSFISPKLPLHAKLDVHYYTYQIYNFTNSVIERRKGIYGIESSLATSYSGCEYRLYR